MAALPLKAALLTAAPLWDSKEEPRELSWRRNIGGLQGAVRRRWRRRRLEETINKH